MFAPCIFPPYKSTLRRLPVATAYKTVISPLSISTYHAHFKTVHSQPIELAGLVIDVNVEECFRRAVGSVHMKCLSTRSTERLKLDINRTRTIVPPFDPARQFWIDITLMYSRLQSVITIGALVRYKRRLKYPSTLNQPDLALADKTTTLSCLGISSLLKTVGNTHPLNEEGNGQQCNKRDYVSLQW